MELIDAISKLKALVNTSLFYSKDIYDIERLEEMKSILVNMTNEMSDYPVEKITDYFNSDMGYVTPKVDVRAVVFNDKNELLLVKEKKEQQWSLPGGWADVGYSPSEIAVKETFEESGLIVSAEKLIKVVDKAKHDYPKSLQSVYKLFFYCIAENFNTSPGVETSEVKFFSKDELYKIDNISEARNTLSDLEDVFLFMESPSATTKFD